MKRKASNSPKNARARRRAPRPVYPFTGIVGQEEMKLALLLNVIDPLIGGVLIMGHRGTAKSTAVRALADLLPRTQCVRDCFYGCDPLEEANLCDECHRRFSSNEKLGRELRLVPVIDLPLNATEDRVCGTINIERALKEGIKAFEPGLLARAHRGFLYIDEVNLLEDHLIDLLLDAAVTGRNLVEREGISVEHPARFVLVGSGNPEEGELRPQLLDRFGLHVKVKTSAELDERVLIVERREAFERDPESFRAGLEDEQEKVRRRLTRARSNAAKVKLRGGLLRSIAELCRQLKIDGHRGELTISRSARALCAFEGRKEVTEMDVRRVAAMALRHRLRRDPLEQTSGGNSTRIEQKLDEILSTNEQSKELKEEGQAGKKPSRPPSDDGNSNGAGGNSRRRTKSDERVDDENQLPAPAALDARLSNDALVSVRDSKRPRPQRKLSRRGTLDNCSQPFNARRGRYTRSVSTQAVGARIAFDATLRAALSVVGSENSLKGAQLLTPVPRQALRFKLFKQKTGTLFIFAVDTSGSMALNRIAQAKGALVRLLQQSYVKRDRVALISFHGAAAEVLMRPGGSVTRARHLLDEMCTGGATPLAAGLLSALGISGHARQQGTERIILLLFTDGRANVPLSGSETKDRIVRERLIAGELEQLGASLRRESVMPVVVDTQNRFTSTGEARKLADLIGGRYVYLAGNADMLPVAEILSR
jgi:magnesium chelatase subunit D